MRPHTRYHFGMSAKPVLRMGDPVLHQVAAPVAQFDTPELRRLVADMTDTMRACDGAGLAAIQIGVLQRVVVFGVEHNLRYPDAAPVPFTVLINPAITPLGNERDEDWEGCLSVPSMRGLVPRYRRIHYRGFDPSGKVIDREVEGFHARVVQHECDHLDGILYPERIEDLRMFGFIEELQQAGLFGARILPAEDTGGSALPEQAAGDLCSRS
jgi:peptide deformylase